MDNNMSPRGGSAYGGKNFDLKKVMQWLGYVLRCPICGLKYRVEGTRVIESSHDEVFNEASILIHSECAKCKSSVMFNVEIRGPEVFSVGMVTDLTHQDSAKFKKHGPIKTNEIIGIHKELKSLRGDFVSLFTSKTSRP